MVRTNTGLVCPNSVSEHGSKVTDKPSVLKRLRMLKELSLRQVLAKGLTRPPGTSPARAANLVLSTDYRAAGKAVRACNLAAIRNSLADQPAWPH